MSQKSQVMVVDDDLAMCGFLRTFLGARNYNALTVTNADEAVRRFHAERPAAVLLDVVMPGSMDGLAALAAFKKIDKDVPIIVISGQGRTSVVVQAMRLGATDFLCKPFEENELEMVIEKALKQHQLSQEVASLRAQLKEQSRYTMLFGHSRQMQEVRDLIERVSDTDVTVLIRGESGVGKELVARALHDQSLRKDKPFVKVNCAALPTELLESELFGFEKGAFTGAIQHKPGKFEFANHGTMFLDEIGDMSFPLQAKLLQALQDGEFSRLGGKSDVRVDVRVITATNCDLEAAVASGRFREDLYFRLNVVTITIPPLRDRREEIPMLTEHFVKKYSVQYNKPFPGISHELSALFLEYEWPGNVRQLENLIKRMVVLGSEAPIVQELKNPSCTSAPRATAPPLQPVMPPPAAAAVAIAPASLAATAPAMVGAGAMMAGAPAAIGIGSVAAVAAPAGASAAVNVSLKDIARTAAREAERELILRMLTRTRWNRKEAAEILGISYKALLYKIKENGLDKAS
ncbi:MAG: sigma-54-dependent Fis family transcriptional regulator [Gammaproteobacteria bacterium]|nr:MAG: sigma-54-dependent Fis family transcriptional regulator [Gammaproteobacteria bacterium]